MTANLNTPNFPVFSWNTFDLFGSMEIENNDTGNFITIDFTNVAFESLWGFALGTNLNCAATSIHGYIAAQIQTFLQGDGSPGATVTCNYNFTTIPGRILVDFVYSGGADDVLLTFIGGSETILGFGNSTVSIFLDDTTNTDYNSTSYWAPFNLTCYDDRRTLAPSLFANQSLDGAIIKTRRWTSERVRRALSFPYVRPAYLWSYRREDTNYASPAGQNIADPNNLYENLLTAARRNNNNANATTFRIYANQDPTTAPYRLGSVVDPLLLQDPETLVVDNANGSALYFNASVIVQDLGDDGSGGI